MKQGKSLMELATEITRQNETKRDTLVKANSLQMRNNADGLRIVADDGKGNGFLAPMTETAHSQIGQYTGIPAAYYRKMQAEDSNLLSQNVNTWLGRSGDRRLVRMLDGNVRAFLSDRYAMIDNNDLLEVVLPVISQKGMRIVSCDVTERKLYVKATTERLSGEVAVGDTIQGGLVISNSEIGMGSVSISDYIVRLICLNGATYEQGLRRNHIGRRLSEEDLSYYSMDTRRLDTKAFMAKVSDTMSNLLSEERFGRIVAGMRETKAFQIDKQTTDVQKLIEDVTSNTGLTEREGTTVLEHLVRGGDLSAFGLTNAVTRTAEDAESYDRASDIERIGGMMFGWSVAEWKTVGMVRQ